MSIGDTVKMLGCTVQLVSGGPLMTVHSHDEGIRSPMTFQCVWYEEGQYKYRSFPLHCLKVIKE